MGRNKYGYEDHELKGEMLRVASMVVIDWMDVLSDLLVLLRVASIFLSLRK